MLFMYMFKKTKVMYRLQVDLKTLLRSEKLENIHRRKLERFQRDCEARMKATEDDDDEN